MTSLAELEVGPFIRNLVILYYHCTSRRIKPNGVSPLGHYNPWHSGPGAHNCSMAHLGHGGEWTGVPVYLFLFLLAFL